ncbi:MAG: hypothetical protein QM831_37410 [Kofleriaceae bacterium]
MTKLADIEAALARSFTRENLAIFADALLADGDLRGELVHIDLAADPALAARRSEVEAEWLAYLPRPLVVTTKYGFIAAEISGTAVTPLLESPYYRAQIRHLIIDGPSNFDTAFYGLRHGPPMPFLWSLACEAGSGAYNPLSHTPVLDEATPNLHALSIHGRAKFLQFAHANVRHLSIRGLGKMQNPAKLPRVTRFELRFEPFEYGIRTLDDAIRHFEMFHVPELEHLDLRGNTNPMFDAYSFADRLKLPDSLETITLPPRFADHHEAMLGRIRTRFPDVAVSEDE